MAITEATVYDANYTILTREQFVTDYPNADVPTAVNDDARALVLYDDEELLITALWGSGSELSTFTGDLAKYAASNANPGPVEAKVGHNTTVIG
jgi:hypothetical protein